MTPQRPKVSRKPIVLLVSLCLLVSAISIPVAAKLPRWIEIELVLAAWWLVWVVAMVWLLYRGHAVDDDAEWMGSVDRFKRWAPDLAHFPLDGCFFDEGCATFLLAILAFLLLGLAFLLVIEFIVPAIALLLLASIGGMFARAINDTHGCEGRFGTSLFWGILWATIYIGPVAAIAIWVSKYLAHRG